MADRNSNLAESHPNGNPDGTNQPGFLDRLDSALGLHMAEQEVKDTDDAKDAKDVKNASTEEVSQGHTGQTIATPTITTQELKPTSAPMRPGFFGAGGSMCVIQAACWRQDTF